MSGADHMPVSGSFVVPADHPCLAGHFPSAPIAPAVLLLDLSCAVLQRARPQLGPPLQLKAAKFLQPVLPGETVEVRFEPGASGVWHLSCTVAAGVAVQAQLLFAT